VVETDLHLENVRGQEKDAADADAASQQAYAQFVARRRPVNIPHVPESSPMETHATGAVDSIVRKQENKVH
jgi:hypothetical protein